MGRNLNALLFSEIFTGTSQVQRRNSGAGKLSSADARF